MRKIKTHDFKIPSEYELWEEKEEYDVIYLVRKKDKTIVGSFSRELPRSILQEFLDALVEVDLAPEDYNKDYIS